MMIANLKMFEKIITILLASTLIVRRILAQHHENFDCTTENKNCPTTICVSYSDEKSILPVDSISNDTCSLTIITLGNGSLIITREDTFHKFEKLQNLEMRLTRSLEFVENFTDSTGKEYLDKILLDVPKLTSLSLEYNEFNRESHFWMLPESLEKLHLSNGVFEFNLRYCSQLTSLRLNNNDLSKIPQLHDPIPPLEKLNLKNNPLDEFKVNDIANFCELKYFAVDAIRISGCECTRLKQWKIKSNEWGDFTFEGNIDCEDDSDGVDCTLEDAMQNREKCSPNTASFQILHGNVSPVLLIIISVLITCLCCCICICCIYRLAKRAIGDPETNFRRQMGQPGYGYPGGIAPAPGPYGSPY